MGEQHQIEELLILKVIAETLNKSNDLKKVLQHVLEKLLEVTGLPTGWLFLVGERPEYIFAANHGLPPALSWENKRPMCEGTCYCLNQLWQGNLNQAVNIINCKRLEDARRLEWGDTKGITHHATVPLSAGGEVFGLLNVASPDKEHFNENELNLLQAVALQIGTAIKRTRLYEIQERRADLFSKLDDMIRKMNSMTSLKALPNEVTEQVCRVFGWEASALFMKEEDFYILEGLEGVPFTRIPSRLVRADRFPSIQGRVEWNYLLPKKFSLFPRSSRKTLVAVPLKAGEDTMGLMLFYGVQDTFKQSVYEEILRALSSHVSLAIENLRLYEKQRELEILDERNRLARDLHDAVNQKLFSLSLTAKGAASLAREDQSLLAEALMDIQTLSKEALKEMRALIWQLRPVGLEEGLIEAIKRYGEGLGLRVQIDLAGFVNLPKLYEETLFRIGQEGLNNVRKHAQTEAVFIHIKADNQSIDMEIRDKGIGFNDGTDFHPHSFGLSSMMERAELVGGKGEIKSQLGKGTCIKVKLPNPRKREGD